MTASRLGPRAALIFTGLAFAGVMHYAHVNYLYPQWDYYGFSLRPLGPLEVSLIALLVTLGALALPLTLARPSAVIVLLLYIVVYVPAIVVSLALDTNRLARYGPSLLALGVGFGAACIGSRLRLPQAARPPALPGRKFTMVIAISWILTCAMLVAVYAPIMRFAGLDDTYEQRAAGSSSGTLLGYLQAFLSNVLSPTLIALGLVRRKASLVAIGSIGCVIVYMIAARRTVVLLPIAVIGLYFMLSFRFSVMRYCAFLIAMIAAAVAVSVAYLEDNPFAALLAVFLVFRTLALPGLTFSQYSDLFGAAGHTWWSHVKGFSMFMPTPATFANDPLWPKLGYIIGARVYGNADNDANANLFSGDGVAAAGAFGVIVIGVVFAAWLHLLDRVCNGWDRRFAMLVIMPVALALTNGQLFTVLLSFGGLFWTLVFHLHKPSAGRP